jgi:hypothetical protein
VTDSDRRRFCLTDDDLQELARQAVVIEKHYGRPMDIEWGKDGEDGHLYILQARPETVKSRTGQFVERYRLKAEGQDSDGRSGHRSANRYRHGAGRAEHCQRWHGFAKGTFWSPT